MIVEKRDRRERANGYWRVRVEREEEKSLNEKKMVES